MLTTDRAILLDLLDRHGIAYDTHARHRKNVVNSAFEIEIHNTSDYGDDNASTLWIFNANGALLQIGSFIN